MRLNKFSKKKLTMLVVICIILCINAITVFAGTTPRYKNNYYLAEGVGDIDYYIMPGASGYTTLINNATNNWIYTGFGYNPIYMYRTYNFNESNMDIYDGDYYQAEMDAFETLGKTIHVDVRTSSHQIVLPQSSMWDYGRIYLNFTRMQSLGFSNAKIQGVIIHEMGHVMALDHNVSTFDSIMYPYTDLGERDTVGRVDHDGINAIYH